MTPADYDHIGAGYAAARRPDPRIAEQIDAALAGATTVVNVGAGTGSYEPGDRFVVAVDPSEVMLAQRPPQAAVSVRAVAERLPFPDASFDAAMAILTVHHWSDSERGLVELRRVAPRQVILSYIPGFGADWFMSDYMRDAVRPKRRRLSVDEIAALLGPTTEIDVVPIPADCTDGFAGAYWRRPYAYFDADVQAGMSICRLQDKSFVDEVLKRLARDLDDGTWNERYGHLVDLDEVDLGYRLLTHPDAGAEFEW